MAGMSIDGLSSGLNTTEIVTQLMQLEALPQNQLKSRVAATTKMVTALQGINTRAASVATAAAKLAEPSTWGSVKATASDASVSVTSTTGAAAGSVTFDVVALAAAHSLASPEMAWAAPAPGSDAPAPSGRSVTITWPAGADGTTPAPVTVTTDSDDPRALAAAVNDAKAGVTATAVQTRNGVYRLQLTAAETGADSAFDFSLSGGTGANLVMATAADARIAVNGVLDVTSTTNAFTDVLPGTTFTVTKAVDDVTVSVAANADTARSAVSGLVNNLNVLLSDIASHTKVSVEGSAPGVLVGNSIVRSLNQSVFDAAGGRSTDGVSTGVRITRDGKLSFDEKAFGELMASDPARAQQVVTDLANRVKDVADRASKSGTGSISQLITSQQGAAKSLTLQVESWDRRLELRESTLRAQFSALEVALSNMNSQSSWLAGQLASLPSASNS